MPRKTHKPEEIVAKLRQVPKAPFESPGTLAVMAEGPEGAPRARVDNAIIKALARAPGAPGSADWI